MVKQRALIIIKPDAVQRGLIGKILKRFEQVGLKIVGLKFIWASSNQAKNLYPETEVWFKKVGERTLTNYQKKGLDAKKILGTNDPIEIGKLVKQWLIKYLQESPIFCAVLEGYEAIQIVRKLCGNTIPLLAAAGTIRGDFSHDNIELANENKRPLRNVIHASDDLEGAKREINVWFTEDELFKYERADERMMFI
jgi:nucleoside-diphosphate kinase